MTKIEEYKKELLTLDLMKANLYAIFTIIPVLILYGVPFILLWRHTFSKMELKNFIDSYNLGIWGNMSFILLVITIGIITHELIHGITWAMFTKNGFKSIKVGVLWKMLTPYCHCSEPLKVKHYIAGGIMPAIILGLFPFVYSLFTGNVLWLFFSIFFTMSAVGDLMIVNLVRKEDMNNFVLDHPSEVGCYVFKKE
ncbi:MAG: DUF3267 domain-containing protein [Paludibacter sp.]|nr:DUF3267 domain-containing protein [Paludibacter sp.]